jgi:hypothetical protein
MKTYLRMCGLLYCIVHLVCGQKTWHFQLVSSEIHFTCMLMAHASLPYKKAAVTCFISVNCGVFRTDCYVALSGTSHLYSIGPGLESHTHETAFPRSPGHIYYKVL